MQTHYDILGVSWKANDNEIRAAFRRSVKACHPDLHAGDQNAERQLRRVLSAYEILRKPQQKRTYDRHLKDVRRARNQRAGLTALTGLVCCVGIATLMMWLPKMMQQDASAQPQPTVLATAIASVTQPAQVAVADHASSHAGNNVRAEVNSSSKSDRIAATSNAHVAVAHAVANEAVRTASNTRPAQARRAEPQQPRPAKEWGRIRESDDPMAIAAFAARHPDASESKLARSKLIGLIETADDEALLNILGLGTGDVAERAQQRLARLRGLANDKEETAAAQAPAQAPADVLKQRAASFVSARVAGWSSTNAINLAAHTSAYADEVVYNGSRKSRQAIAREKRRVLELWPERSFEVRPDSITSRCLANVCKVGGIVDWQAHSAARGASASGAARFEYEVALTRGTFQILSENMSELKHPRQATACSTKGDDVATTSWNIIALHRDEARCLHIAGKTSSAKLRTALLAQAHMLRTQERRAEELRAQEQRAREEQTQIVSSFDDRWMQASLLQ
jgi:curved DNA-binding protein CbpA